MSLINRKLPWPLEAPPQIWVSSNLLLFQVNLECEAKRLFHTKLVEQTPSVVLFCPLYNSRNDSSLEKRVENESEALKMKNFNQIIKEGEYELVFRVMTWLPFDPDRQLMLLGNWDRRVFVSFQDLFHDRFQSFGGKTLQVASDDDDAPLLFLDDQNEFEGTCKRILDALSVWLNFTFTLTHEAPDCK